MVYSLWFIVYRYMSDKYDLHIGTEPMASKIDEVSQKVDQTTGAVVGMNAAVIAQEKSSTDQICGRLDTGFYNVVMSQVVQKLANEKAQTKALALELCQQQKAMASFQSRMEGDFNMIAARYTTLFNNLNRELKNRIATLDKPLVDFCSQNVIQLKNRIYNLVSNVPVHQSESLAAAQTIAAAHVKKNARALISTVAGYVRGDRQQKAATQAVCSGRVRAEQVCYVPVIIDEEDTEIRRGTVLVKENPTLKSYYGEAASQVVMQTLTGVKDSLEWNLSGENASEIVARYRQLVDESDLPKRIKDKMIQMLNVQLQTL